jgi:rhamnose transport system permease protein
MTRRYAREIAAGAVLVVVLIVMAATAPSFFTAANLRDLLLNNAGTMVAALGITLILIAGHIDISIGSQFAICSVVAGVAARAGVPVPLIPVLAVVTGGTLGAINGAIVTGLRAPSIVVTLATMITLRDALRWYTQGAWISGLPPGFQWFGMGQDAGGLFIIAATAALVAALAWALRNLAAGRHVFATGSNPEAARLAGIPADRVVTGVFIAMGCFSALAALLNAVRFNEIPGNPGAGLELKAIAAAVVGGASITGGRATIAGTVLGVLLLGTIGTALTYAGINPFWEKAVQGGIILAAAVSEYAGSRRVPARAYAA